MSALLMDVAMGMTKPAAAGPLARELNPSMLIAHTKAAGCSPAAHANDDTYFFEKSKPKIFFTLPPFAAVINRASTTRIARICNARRVSCKSADMIRFDRRRSTLIAMRPALSHSIAAMSSHVLA